MQKLPGCLVPGGSMLIGNLQETPDTSWIMDNLLAWYLVYRTPEDMARLGRGLGEMSGSAEVIADATGRFLFLDVRRA